jgi:hypothetical protein
VETVDSIDGKIVDGADVVEINEGEADIKDGIKLGELITVATVGAELAVEIAAGTAVTVIVTVFGVIADVRSNEEVTLWVKMDGDAVTSVDECESISRCLQVKSSSRELVLILTISKDEKYVYLRSHSRSRNLARPDVNRVCLLSQASHRQPE